MSEAPAVVGVKGSAVLCVDLDGTLISGDLFWESVLRLLARDPWRIFQLPFWALQGRAVLKRRVATLISIEAARLPYRAEVLEHLQTARRNGHTLVLATGSDELYARQVVEHLGIFSGVVASDGSVNLTGRSKAERLRAEFGNDFHYFGNGWADLPVWEAAGAATVVAAPSRLLKRVQHARNATTVMGAAPMRLRSVLRAMRLHQWAKNLLLFAPLVLSHQIFNPGILSRGIFAFLAFGLCASSIYIVNDLFDIQSDRAHPTKRLRPFAAGELSVPSGLVLAAVLFAAGAGTAAFGTSPGFLLVVLIYMGVTTAYSARLKREPLLDVFVLASLYVLRIIGGGAAIEIEITNWLLGFALFFFLSLAFVKRYTELIGQGGRMPGRGYSVQDHSLMLSIGTSSGYMSVVILALYVNSTDVAALYNRPRVLWLAGPVLLYWISRMWLRAGRKQVHDDPVLEALKDPVSYVCALLALGILLAAL